MAVYCRSCGASMAEEVRFCAACGAANPVPPGFQSQQYTPRYRPLVRPRVGRLIAGVCQGIANQHNWDPAWVRVIMVLSTIFLGGMGAIAYLVLWVAVPEESLSLPAGTIYTPPAPYPNPPQPPYSSTSGS